MNSKSNAATAATLIDSHPLPLRPSRYRSVLEAARARSGQSKPAGNVLEAARRADQKEKQK